MFVEAAVRAFRGESRVAGLAGRPRVALLRSLRPIEWLPV